MQAITKVRKFTSILTQKTDFKLNQILDTSSHFLNTTLVLIKDNGAIIYENTTPNTKLSIYTSYPIYHHGSYWGILRVYKKKFSTADSLILEITFGIIQVYIS